MNDFEPEIYQRERDVRKERDELAKIVRFLAKTPCVDCNDPECAYVLARNWVAAHPELL